MLTLRPWQQKSVEHLYGILQSGKNALDASDGGIGKTYVACAVSAMLGKNTLAIVPKISVSAWHSVAEGFAAPVQAVGYEALRTGRTNFGRWERPPPPGAEREIFYQCEVCLRRVTLEAGEPGCPHHPSGIHAIKIVRKPWRCGKFSFSPEVEFLLVDEVHRCGGALDSLNSDMLCAAKRQGIPTLAMSATAACGPLQLRALGYLLGLHGLDWAGVNLPNWRTWAHRQGCRHDPNFHGLVWLQPEERKQKILRDIRSDIFPSQGVRVSTAEVPGFPKRIISAEVFDIDKPGLVDKLYEEMNAPLAALATASADDSSAEHPLTKLLRARQKLELLKVPIAVELCQDELSKGRSVALFVNFRQTLEELQKKLKTDCIIAGGQHDSDRNNSIHNFQNNSDRVIIANSAAGGVSVSLHDLDGEHPRTGLVMPSHSAVQMLQVFFRLAREGGKSTAIYKVLLAAGTIERKIQKAFESKRDCIDSLNDGDLNPI